MCGECHFMSVVFYPKTQLKYRDIPHYAWAILKNIQVIKQKGKFERLSEPEEPEGNMIRT